MSGGRVWYGVAIVFLVAAFLTGALVGPVHLGVANVLRGTFAHVFGGESPLAATDDAILWQIRLPRVVLGALVGGTLACAGAAYQGTFRNPLADDLVPLAAFVGASIAVVVAYVIGRSAGTAAAALVLAGVTVASFFTAMQTYVQQQNVDTVQEVYAWLLGRLGTSGWREVLIVLPYAIVSWTVILLHRRLLVVAAATIGTAAAVAVSGLIGFVGIIVPHTIRLLAGGSYRLLLPLAILVGAGFLVFADVIARTVVAPAELPIGVVTAFFGAPFFAIVLRTSRRGL